MLKERIEVLDNGLRVIIVENHRVPVASLFIFYRVGSRNERPGITGISHFIEHMLFKGAGKYGKGDIDRLVCERGGRNNGMTCEDFTVYLMTIPAPFIDLVIDIEAERMRNAVFDEREVEAERTVILSEREGAENYPSYLLGELVRATAFIAHPYRWPVIGWKSDIQSITRDDLVSYYNDAYTPDNAVISIAGDVDPYEVMRIIKDKFGEIDAKSRISEPRTKEPKQRGERRVVLRKPGKIGYLYVAYHVPNARSEDTIPLIILDAILGGASSINPLSGANFVKSSRLYNILVNRGLANWVSVRYGLTLDPYIFFIKIGLRSNVSHEKVEKVLFKEIDNIRRGRIKESELKRAKNQIKAQWSYAWEDVTGVAGVYGFFDIITGLDFLKNLPSEVEKISIKDVVRVADEYLVEDNRTVGWFIPQEEAVE